MGTCVILNRPHRARASVALLLLLACGCQGALFMMNDEKLKKVPAECDKLQGKRVAVVVWADHSTLDADPFACTRTASAIELFLNANTSRKELKGTTLVDNRAVNDLYEQLGNIGPSLSNSEVAKRLKADIVVRVDLSEYTTRAPEANGLILAKVSGNVSVHAAGEAAPLYRAEAAAAFPEGTKVGVLDKSDEEVMTQALNVFGERVARKFYSHEEKYK